MTKADLIDEVSRLTELTRKDSEAADERRMGLTALFVGLGSRS
jgi:hypothetical protein